MSRRAVVLEVGGEHATVLLEGGELRRLSLKGKDLAPGQEIWVPDGAGTFWASPFTRAAAAVAALAILGGGYFSTRPKAPPVAAWLSVDINPSVSLGVSVTGTVVQVEAFDAAGSRLVAQLPHLRGSSIADALSSVAAAARQDGYLGAKSGESPYIVLAAAPVTAAERAFTKTAVQNAARELGGVAHRDDSTLVTLPLGMPDDVASAAAHHVSLGRYLLGKLTGASWRQVERESLVRILDQWPSVQQHTSSSAPPSSSASSSSQSSVPPSTSPPTSTVSPSSTSKSVSATRTPASSSVPAVVTVSGTLTAVGPDSVTVAGTSYPVSGGAKLVVNGITAQLSLAVVVLLENQRVTLTLADGAVTQLAATLSMTRTGTPPILPPPVVPASSRVS